MTRRGSGPLRSLCTVGGMMFLVTLAGFIVITRERPKQLLWERLGIQI